MCKISSTAILKIQVINKLGDENLEAMLQIALEGPEKVVDDIISDVVPLWENDTKYHFLYVNPSFYLNSTNTPSVSDVSCSFGAVDINGNSTRISWLSILTNHRKILGPFMDLVFSKGQKIFGSKMVGALLGLTPAKDTI